MEKTPGGTTTNIRMTGDLFQNLTKRVFYEIEPHLRMRTKIIVSFESWIERLNGELVKYCKTLPTCPTCAIVKEMRDYLSKWEKKRLDLDDTDVWSGGYLPSHGGGGHSGANRGQVHFSHVNVKLITSGEPL